MTTFQVEVTYALGHNQIFEGLTTDQVDQCAHAFMSDLMHLEGRGITRLLVTVEPTPAEALAKHLSGWAPGNLQSHLLHDHHDRPPGLRYNDPLDLVHEALHVGRTEDTSGEQAPT